MTGALFQSWTAARIAEACGGRAFGETGRTATGIANDSRRLRPGELFVALRAERDGHQFIDAARQSGAGVLMVEHSHRPEPRPGEAVVSVGDTFAALRDLGRALWAAHGDRRRNRVGLGITGSNGKTTTKEIVAAMLETVWPGQVLKTEGNLNNHIGLPITLGRLGLEHRFAVLEMGASEPGDIALLVGIAPVDRALVTSVSAAHLEGLGDEKAVADEKGAILRGERPAAIGVVPDSHREQLVGEAEGHVRTFGEQSGTDVRLVAYRPGSPSTVTLRIAERLTDGPPLEVTLSFGLVGRHNALNLAAALALIWDLLPSDERLEVMSEVAAGMRPVAGRLTWVELPGGAWVLDDTYNANPGSLAAALDALSERPGRPWLILGDMLELGAASAAAHREAGHRAAEAGCGRVWGVGAWASEVAAGARAAGAAEVAAFDDARACADAARESIANDDVVLVKGSRGVQLETVVAALCQEVN